MRFFTKKNSVRLLSVLLAICCLLPAFGCSKKDAAVKTKPENVFSAEYIKLPIELEYIYNFKYFDGKLFVSGSKANSYEQVYFICNLDGSGLQELNFNFDPEGESSYGDNPVEEVVVMPMPRTTEDVVEVVEPSVASDTNGDGIMDDDFIDDGFAVIEPSFNAGKDYYLDNVFISPDNKFYLIYSWWYYDAETEMYEDGSLVRMMDFEGNILLEKDLMEIFGGDPNEYYYIGRMIFYNDQIIITQSQNIYVFNPDLELQFKIEAQSYVDMLLDTPNGLLISYYDETDYTSKFRYLDLENQKLGEDVSISFPSGYYGMVSSTSENTKYSLYYTNTTGLYGFDITTGESFEIINWLNSDVPSISFENLNIISDTQVICTMYDDLTYKNEIVLFNYVDPANIVEKYSITLAAYYTSSDTRRAVLAFNKKSSEYRIKIIDYSQYNTADDYSAGVTAFNNDIISGKIPDIFEIHSELPIDSYISKGLLADLNKFMEQDESFNREDYLTNVFDAFSVDGKLYQLVPSFYTSVLVAKEKFTGDVSGWTMDEMNAILAQNPGMQTFQDMTRDTLLYQITRVTYENYIDKATGMCSFNSPEFVSVLEFVNSISNESMWDTIDWETIGDDFWDNYDAAFRNDQVLMAELYLSTYNDFWRVEKGQFGDDIAFVGYPSDDRNGYALSPNCAYAISSRSKVSEGAWEFLTYFLSDEYQDNIQWNWPIKLSSLDKLAKTAMTPRTYEYTDENGNVIVKEEDNTYWFGGDLGSVSIGYIDQEGVDKVNAFLKSITKVVHYDTTVSDIINEEASAYFAGTNNAQQAADLIQGRVSLYVNESR